MSTEDMKCNCGSSKADFFEYSLNEDLLGVLCQSCWKEWLLEEYVSESDGQSFTYNGKKYMSPSLDEAAQPALCQMTPLSEEVVSGNVEMKPGDHIMWLMSYITWHHAIVEDVMGPMLSLVHFSKEPDTGKFSIIKEEKAIAEVSQDQNLYKVTYGEDVRRRNPSELVLARARALIGMDSVNLLEKNCENFASFCKSGINSYQESQWFEQKMREILRSVWKRANFTFVSPMIKSSEGDMLQLEVEERKIVTRCADAIGAGVIVAFQGGICMWDLGRLYQRYMEYYRNKKMSRMEFIQLMVKEISKKFFEVFDSKNMTAMGKMKCPGLGEVVGVVLGIIGGCVGPAINQVIRMTIGKVNLYERAVLRKLKPNNRMVTLDDLQPGDHIISYKYYPTSCHGIVVQVHKSEQRVIFIRLSEEKGVILDELFYDGYDPLFKVTYSDNVSSYSGEEIVNRAIKEVARETILWNNCENFVCSMTLKAA